ncbi:pyrimidine-nucleoside phosphorylase [Bacillus thuringiensis]|uniref:pyrimidine-nucleoside phosphorylase n=1 Tax=Bacillus thuringiensis TaxID=1428 RepID=UPI000A37DEA5|nr:pyrimidine-nucleoside phosphorylase [Bacillus thuringiensis]OUA56162.1 pyrimidine-nucleoside phosphorylase [Bacillus thuringiensis serovar aizawai]
MRILDLIEKKREGFELTTSEIQFLIDRLVYEEVPDYQISAWAMAVYFQGMTSRELADLTIAMANSGKKLNFNDLVDIKVDKHSTGGVGDTTTLILVPWVSAAGLSVAKMSGRSLGDLGGTIDKLESIPGFSVEVSQNDFIEQIKRYKVGLISQSSEISPADKKLYAIRDVTATAEAMPLIASSIMSKKIAGGADKIVLDVKFGKGAFMKTSDDAITLAKMMVKIGTDLNRETVAIVSRADEPIGYAVGNALEVKEAVATLQGKGPKDLEELCLTLGSYMLLLGNKAQTIAEARSVLKEVLYSGAALEQFSNLMNAQGANPQFIYDLDKLPKAKWKKEIIANTSGFINEINAKNIGSAAMLLGAGRERKDDTIDYGAGCVMKKKVGDKVRKGDILAEIHWSYSDKAKTENIIQLIEKSIYIKQKLNENTNFNLAVITKEDL